MLPEEKRENRTGLPKTRSTARVRYLCSSAQGRNIQRAAARAPGVPMGATALCRTRERRVRDHPYPHTSGENNTLGITRRLTLAWWWRYWCTRRRRGRDTETPGKRGATNATRPAWIFELPMMIVCVVDRTWRGCGKPHSQRSMRPPHSQRSMRPLRRLFDFRTTRMWP